MKRIRLFGLMFILSCGTSNNKPILFVERPYLDMGVIKFDSTYYIKYIFWNKGTSAILIDTARSSCGCTIASISQKKILPGDSGMLYVRFKPADTGTFKKEVVMKSNIEKVFTVFTFAGKSY